jgi:putative tricarboxylic transport membrane protein
MRLPDQVTGLFLVGLGGAAAYGGWLLPPVPGQPVGPNVFPLVIGTGLALCGLAITFGIGHSFEEEEELIPVEQGQAQEGKASEGQAAPPAGRFHGLRALLPPALLMFYVVAADWLGFFITAALITLATSTALGARWKLALPLAVLAPVGIHLIFGKLLRVPLPLGLLPMPW